MSSVYERDYATPAVGRDEAEPFRTRAEREAHVEALQAEMRAAAANLDFEKAAALRDRIKRLRDDDLGLPWPARKGPSAA
jgi:excinuclease ABC subunit B